MIAAAFSLAAVPTGVSAQSDADRTFACDPGFYQVISGQLASLSPGTASYNSIGADHSNYNAMGYRIADGFLYGMAGQQLFRIDARGERTLLAVLDVRSGAYTGDFGDDGLLHISRGGGDWYAVDVDTFVATSIPELSKFKGVADITNVHGKFYGVSSNGILYIYDPVALTLTSGGTVSGLPEKRKSYGAAWSTAGGNLYVGRNTGEIYQVTGFSTGAPVATHIGNAPPTNSNDGASCSLAQLPPGLHDVDGPEPETAPSTPEAIAATNEYIEQFSEIEKTFADLEEVEDSGPSSEPTDPEPVTTENTETKPVDDAGIGQGAGCETTTDFDRPDRAELGGDLYPKVEAETTLYQSGFDGTVISDFTLLSGNWYMDDGHFSQLNTCGFDYSALLDGIYVDNFRWEATFKAITGTNQGGLLFNQSAGDTRSGAMVVDFAAGGSVLRWGTYDEAGYYSYGDSIAVKAPGTLEVVTLTVEVIQSDVKIFLNGEQVAATTTVNKGGLVGLIASETDIGFDSVKLVALPAPAADTATTEPAPEATADTATTEPAPETTTEPSTTEPAPETTTEPSTTTTEAD